MLVSIGLTPLTMTTTRRRQRTQPQEGTPLPTTTKKRRQRDADDADFDDEAPNTRRQQQQQRRDADGENVLIIDKILTYFSVLPFRKATTKNEVLQYLIKVCLFLIISKNIVFKNKTNK